MAVGLPFHQLPNVMDGLLKTVNVMEPNHKKDEIQREMELLGYTGLEIKFNENYYTGLFDV